MLSQPSFNMSMWGGVLWGRRLPDHLPLCTQRPCGCSGSVACLLKKTHGAVKLILGRAALQQGQ